MTVDCGLAADEQGQTKKRVQTRRRLMQENGGCEKCRKTMRIYQLRITPFRLIDIRTLNIADPLFHVVN